MVFLLSFLASAVLAVVGYTQARAFVHGRLRYVDAVHSWFAPIIAGVGAALLALPLVAILPFVWLKRPWALRLWHRAGLIAAIYALVVLLSAIIRLVFNWHAIYG